MAFKRLPVVRKLFKEHSPKIALRSLSKTFPSPVEPGIWTKYASNPVLETGTGWEADAVDMCCVIKDGDTYKMWYGGSNGQWRIGYATSGDGIAWTKYGGNPVLSYAGSQWESTHVWKPYVIKDGDTYKMWYTGKGVTTYIYQSIGYATSGDGIAWTKNAGNPIVGDPTHHNTFRGCVVKDGPTDYKMIYKDWDNILYKISSDGITWTDDTPDPGVIFDLGSGGEWDDNIISDWQFINDNGVYRMVYTGHDGSTYRIGYATSGDCITWTKSESNPILDIGSGWENAGIYHPYFIKDGTTYKMWYSGWGSVDQIGYATSP